jgi:hypothetical protein
LRFGGQAGQMLGAAEHRSARIVMRKRGAEAATTQMARMGAEDLPMLPPTDR